MTSLLKVANLEIAMRVTGHRHGMPLTRTMVGLPSQLGNQIVDDVCKKPVKLEGCCCPSAVEALWHLQLPVAIRAHVSNMEFSQATFKSVFEAADKVFLSSKQVSVAALQKVEDLDETQPAFDQQNQPVQVAAATRGGGKGNRGGSGSGRGGASGRGKNQKGNRRGGQGQGGQGRGPRHSSNPPESVCNRHWKHGPESWFCVAPLTCPWKDKCSARP